MKADFFIDRPVFSTVLSIIIVIVGGIGLALLPVDQYPQIVPPVVRISASYPGADAQTVTQAVATPIEQELNGTPGMIYMESSSSNSGGFSATVTFDISTDPDLAAVDIQNRLKKAEARLPAEVVQNGISVEKQAASKLMTITLLSSDPKFDEIYLSNYATLNVLDMLRRVPGVGSVSNVGSRYYAMQIWVMPDKLADLGLTVKDLQNALKDQNRESAAGVLGQAPMNGIDVTIPITAQGRLSSVSEFEDIVVRANPDGSIIRLKDVARISLEASSYSTESGINGGNAAVLNINMLPGANAMEVAGSVKKVMEEIRANFPEGISYEIPFDMTTYLLAELNYKRFMFKKLCILLIFSKLNEIKHLIDKYRMHNLYAIFAKLLNICKQIAGNLVNESGNVPRRGVVPKFSDLEVVALNMASEAVGIDSESLLFANLQEYRVEIPNLISRRQYNDRRKITSSLCNAIRERMVAKMDGGEDYFCIDSKPIEVCRIARSKRCSMGKKDFSKAPGVGYCASQSMYYYGYKLHAVCGLSGVIHSFDLTKASVHDIHYLKDVKVDYSNCTVIGDRGYISAQVQLDLFETANIRLEVPYRCNQKEWKPTFPAFAKARKRIETLFSQLCDQFMIIRNYAKDTDGLFARIIGKISALTILQYINYKNEKPIGRVKYALF